MFTNLDQLIEIASVVHNPASEAQLKRALNEVMADTLNVKWHEELSWTLKQQYSFVHPDSIDWRQSVLDRYNAQARVLRGDYHAASETLDNATIADAAIKEGIWHAQAGEFRAAQASFNTACNVYESRKVECQYYLLQIDMLQADWAVTNSEKTLELVLRETGPFSTEVLLSFTLCMWKACRFADTAILLLHVASRDYTPSELWPWLNRENLAAMCVSCCLLTLDREAVEFLLLGDLSMAPVFLEFGYLKELVQSFLDVDIVQFWKCWQILLDRNQNSWLLDANFAELGTKIKHVLVRSYLSVRTKTSIATFMAVMGCANVLELAVVVRSSGYPVELDPIHDTVTVKHAATEPRQPSDMYIRDAIATIWHGLEVKHGSGFEPLPSPDQDDIKARRRRNRDDRRSGPLDARHIRRLAGKRAQ